MYEYRALITETYDADTITVDLDLGVNVWLKDCELRFARINAPEVKGIEKEAGLASKAFMLTRIGTGSMILVRTQLDEEDTFKRLLADIYPMGFNGYCLNDLLVEQGFAEYKTYK